MGRFRMRLAVGDAIKTDRAIEVISNAEYIIAEFQHRFDFAGDNGYLRFLTAQSIENFTHTIEHISMIGRECFIKAAVMGNNVVRVEGGVFVTAEMREEINQRDADIMCNVGRGWNGQLVMPECILHGGDNALR